MKFWERLSRPATVDAYLPELDALRALAIGLVFWLHLATTLERNGATPPKVLATLSAGGGWGVALFFTISGFVLALPFARHAILGQPAPSLRAYYLRRIRRIEPPYLIALALAFAAQVISHRATVAELLPHLATSAVYVHNVVYGTWSAVLPVAWSLEIEVQFYLVAPILFRMLKTKRETGRRATIWIATGLAFVGSTFFHDWLARHRLDRSLLSDGGFFVLGLALAELHVSGVAPRPSGVWDIAIVFAVPVALWFWPTQSPVAPALGAIAAVVAFGAAFYGKLARRAALWPPAAAIGGMCYSLYLTHYPLFFGLVPRLPPGILAGPAAATVALLFGTGFYVAAERPFLTRRKNVKVL